MSTGWILVLAAVVGYAVGTINPASLIARARGIDLKEIGSGNPGATNAARAMGKKTGILVAILDILKGLLPALAFGLAGTGAAEMAGFAAVVGHITSPFLRGRGGKGVATTLGAVLGAQPLWAPFVLLAFGIGYAITRRVGDGSCRRGRCPLCGSPPDTGSGFHPVRNRDGATGARTSLAQHGCCLARLAGRSAQLRKRQLIPVAIDADRAALIGPPDDRAGTPVGRQTAGSGVTVVVLASSAEESDGWR